MKFATYIKEKHSGFDFDLSAFKPIVDIIDEIILNEERDIENGE